MRFWIILFMSNVLLACKENSVSLTQAFDMAGENRKELQKVLDHYNNNPQKLKAASFLISNMINKFSLDSTSVQDVQPYYDAMIHYVKEHDDYGVSMMYYICDSIRQLKQFTPNNSSPLYENDLQIIDANFLIQHIDRAFDAWHNNPQTNDMDFEIFCRYILPYTCDHTFWPDAFAYQHNLYGHWIDSLRTQSFIDVAKAIDQDIKANFRQDGVFLQKYPFLQPTIQRNYMLARLGSCAEANYTVITALRSLGIPAVLNLIPYWGNSNAAHTWTEIIGDDPITLCDNEQRQYAGPQSVIISDMFWDNHTFNFFEGIPDAVDIRWNRTIPKVFRQTFDMQDNSLINIKEYNIPDFFNTAYLEDITDKYIECSDVKIHIDRKYSVKKVAYLCCYVPETYSWTPVAWGKFNSDNTVLFRKMGKNIIYMPCYFEHNEVYPISSPFLLTSEGEIQYLDAQEEKEPKVILYSKVPYRSLFLYCAQDMLNCKFKLANDNGMSDTITIHTITNIPYYKQEITIDNAPESRYAIYDFTGSNHGFIAELEFYGLDENGHEIKLTGSLIGNPGVYGSSIEEINDGEPVSCFICDKSCAMNYVGFDFGKPRKITRIVYLPRNDDNGIVAGELYELFYWRNGQWESLGQKKGRNDKTLIYENVPKNALMRLHNVTIGNGNRIFIYKNGKQIFY